MYRLFEGESYNEHNLNDFHVVVHGHLSENYLT